MDRETAKAINALSKKMNEIDAKLDRYLSNRCDNTDDEVELQSECLDESAECISELYERIEALEEIIINGGNE